MRIKAFKLKYILLLAWGMIITEIAGQEVVSIELKRTRSLHQVAADYGAIAQNGVELYAVTYTTDDVFGERDTASGLLVLPVREGNITYPVLCYQHGTVSSRQDVPSNLRGGFQLGEVFGSIGYVVVAPDYLGLGTSRGFHPYVHAASEASAAIDMITAVKKYAEENNIVSVSDQLFITGYSQGGHAALALQKAIEENSLTGLTVTASAPLSGPYSISGVMKDQILSETPYFYPSYVPNTLLSYNYVYNIFEDPVTSVFKEPYASDIRRFYNEEIDLFQLNTLLVQKLVAQTGSSVVKRMLQDSIIAILLEEPEHPLNGALQDNDLLDWVPRTPTRLVYCRADDQVPFRNSTLADSVLNENGALDLESVDVNSGFDHGQCVQPANIYAALFFEQYKQIITGSADRGSEKPDVRIYPNPATTKITFENLQPGMKATLLSMGGEKLWERVLDTETIGLETVSSGVYVLRVETGRGLSKLIKLVVK